MKKKANRWTTDRSSALVGILILCIALAVAHEARAWGGRFGYGGFGGRGFYGGGYGSEESPGMGSGEVSPGGGGSQVYTYPSRSQSPQQQQTDRGQCYTWAVQQSGFDPANPRVPGGPAPAVGAPQGGLFRGAAGGAALGAIGGAIGGNAGKGAAIGAGTGAVFGGMRRRRWAEREEFQQTSYLEQQQSALNQGRGNFNQAFGVCMTGRRIHGRMMTPLFRCDVPVGGTMKLLSAIAVLFITVGVCLEPYSADAAGKYDGSVPFLCVPTAVAECVAEGECRPGTAESENLPDFFKIDLKAKTVRAENKGRLSLIKRIDRGDGEIILYGSEAERSWVLMIQEKTGKMSAAVTGDGESFAIFGICPAP